PIEFVARTVEHRPRVPSLVIFRRRRHPIPSTSNLTDIRKPSQKLLFSGGVSRGHALPLSHAERTPAPDTRRQP
ncbi:MAG: hypothetical protein V3V97_16200, partial [Hyphomicrobiaceae bacterium]